MQIPLIRPDMPWKAPNLDSLPRWRDAKVVGFDLETWDPHLDDLGPGYVGREGEVLGVSFAIEDYGDGETGFYLPTRHLEGNLDPDKVQRYIGDQFKDFTGELVGSKLIYDLGWGRVEGWRPRPEVTFFDVGIAEPIIDDLQHTYGLEAIAKRYGFEGKDEELLRSVGVAYKKAMSDKYRLSGSRKFEIKRYLRDLPAAAVGPYGEVDTTLPLKIRREQRKKLDQYDLWQVFDLEAKVLPAILEMQLRGVRVDLDQVDRVDQMLVRLEREHLAKVKHLTGVSLSSEDLDKSEVLGRLLKRQGLDVPLTEKTRKFSVKNKWLDGQKDEVCKALSQARQYKKPRNAFIASIRRHMIGDRLYPGYNQLVGGKGKGKDATTKDSDVRGAKYGRCSSTNPNIQQAAVPSPCHRQRVAQDGSCPISASGGAASTTARKSPGGSFTLRKRLCMLGGNPEALSFAVTLKSVRPCSSTRRTTATIRE